jgi:hypothetical protein
MAANAVGLDRYLKDIFYVASFVLFVSVVTDYVFYLWIVVILFAAFKLWGFAKPWYRRCCDA